MKESERPPHIPTDAKIVRIWSQGGAFLIYPAKTNVFYHNQTGGVSCLQPIMEGILIPFQNEYPLANPEENLARQLEALISEMYDIDSSSVDKLDAILASNYLTRCVTVDRSRLKESCEAWVYVNVVESPECDFLGFGAFSGVLTWHNSD